MPCGSSARSRRGATLRRPNRPKPTTGKPSPWPTSSACARSLAHCHRGLGMLYRETGQQAQARTELLAAITLYRAMEMTFWLPQTEAALARVEG